MPCKGIIFDIQKFSIHDGPGIRTTVFFKGCPLRCIWCHNPESQSFHPELMFTEEKCIGCGMCKAVCPENCQVFGERHSIERERCRNCGRCTQECYSGALEMAGREASVEEVMSEVLKDRPFYENSGGGITLSGGEPMAQFDFALALLQRAKAEGLHVCLDTCGYADFGKYEKALPYVDLFLYDLKATDPEKHRRFTGVDNALILENLSKLDRMGGKTVLRCPMIPGLNDDEGHLKAIAEIAESLRFVQEITLHPYHPLGLNKCARLGRKPAYPNDKFASDEAIGRALALIQKHTHVKVRKA